MMAAADDDVAALERLAQQIRGARSLSRSSPTQIDFDDADTTPIRKVAIEFTDETRWERST